MSRKHKIRDQRSLYFVTFTVIQWIDVFTRNVYRDIIIDSFKFCQQNKGLELYAYCIMTNHLHAILGSAGKEKIENIIRDFKKFTSTNIIMEIKNNPEESRKKWMLKMMAESGADNSNNKLYQFWQQHNHPLELSDNRIMENTLNYTHENPVKAGFVTLPEEYLYSSARNYAGMPGTLIDVKFIE